MHSFVKSCPSGRVSRKKRRQQRQQPLFYCSQHADGAAKAHWAPHCADPGSNPPQSSTWSSFTSYSSNHFLDQTTAFHTALRLESKPRLGLERAQKDVTCTVLRTLVNEIMQGHLEIARMLPGGLPTPSCRLLLFYLLNCSTRRLHTQLLS